MTKLLAPPCEKDAPRPGTSARPTHAPYGLAGQKASRATFLDRFWARVDIRGPEDCWEWQGSKYPKGYGRFYHEGKLRHVHRIAYELVIGPIPQGLTLDHLCRNRACVNPEHLEPTTNRENILRGESPSARAARQTHCIRGHPFEGDNLRIDPDGERVCLACRRARARRYRAQKAAT